MVKEAQTPTAGPAPRAAGSPGSPDLEPAPAYRSYLLRLRPRQVGGHSEWAVTLESISTGLRVTLPDLASLVAFLSRPADEQDRTPAVPASTAPARLTCPEEPRCPATAR